MHRATAGRAAVGVAAAAALAVAVAACGGGGSAAKDDPDPGPATRPADTGEPTPEEKFQAAHFQACDAMCSLLTRCSQVELKAHWDELSPEDQAEAEKIGPKELAAHTDQCVGGCQDADVSVRQVEVLRECVQGMPVEGAPAHDQCHQFDQCLQAAQKGGG